MILKREKFEYQNKTLIERVTINPPYKYEAIFQNEGCFIYVKGSDSKFLSSENNLNLNENQAVLLNCGTYFVEWLEKSKQTIEVIAFHLYPEILKKIYLQELPKSLTQKNRKNQIKKIDPDNTISKFVDSLNFYFQNPALVNEDLLELKIKELILLLVQTKNSESILEIISDLYSPNVVSIKKVIKLHLYENLSLEELAKLCNLSLSSFKRQFKTIFQDSPTNYINHRRIEKAKELLKVSDYSISEISFHIGIQDPQYFTRFFKKKVGITPSSFRKKQS
ncbi:AraC family transcriptional regulator [Maribacter caenipelagi]|uniref:AraC family transcriptional regulator n=1 Tax=Maribacter caenipelagi TaxID=1447781 RepID=A0A4V3E1J6_9FLAO|nr:AraC family transcriptional regulator [Maribacter caenipelagi]TDS13578.1 AraC family transcriptional regulator [Maribacter caenipelagi]